jgi:hypothetical protein
MVQDVFMNTCMRVYTHHDVRGVELCGALKNIIALATGISSGLGFGDNTRAALITLGIAEIKRLDPSYAPAVHLGDLPFAHRFAELRDLGLSVAEALAAAAPRFDRYDGRRHLRAVAPRGTKSPDGGLDRDRMKEAKMLFSGMSEAEINALYRRVSQKNN